MPDLLGYIGGLVIIGPPFYYGWKIFAAFRQRPRTSALPATVCLLLWVLQFPPMIFAAVGCLGGGCEGTLLSNTITFALVVAYDLGPVFWLWRRSSTPRRSD
jgi:hypothetical protein